MFGKKSVTDFGGELATDFLHFFIYHYHDNSEKNQEVIMEKNSLKERRKMLGLSQYDMEKFTQIPQSKLSLAERGLRTLNSEELEKISRIFGVSAEKK